MVNMNVAYRRSCHSLTKLQAEIRKRFPGREQNKGFVTGYPSGARNGARSGHYPDHQGITFAYDIGVDIEGDGSGLRPEEAEWLCEHLCSEMHLRFQYLIYRGRIRGNHTNWKWIPYTGTSPHNDHIHISVVDCVYGEPSGLAKKIFDSRKSWGVAKAIKPKPARKPRPKKDQDGTSKAVKVVRIAGRYGVKHRIRATTASRAKAVYDPYTSLHIAGWVKGQKVNGSNKWLVGAISGGYMHISGFQEKSTRGLPYLGKAEPSKAPRRPRPVDVVRLAGRYGVKHRIRSTTHSRAKATYRPGAKLHVEGWVKGQRVNGSNRWLKGARTGGFMHISGFAKRSTRGLPRLDK